MLGLHRTPEGLRTDLRPNKANLRDLIAATGLVILLKLDSFIDFSAMWPWNLIDDLEKL